MMTRTVLFTGTESTACWMEVKSPAPPASTTTFRTPTGCLYPCPACLGYSHLVAAWLADGGRMLESVANNNTSKSTRAICC